MLSSSVIDIFRKQVKPEAKHFDAQRARCRNKTLLTQSAPINKLAVTAGVGQSEVHFIKDVTRSLQETTEDISKQVCAQTQRLPSVTTLLNSDVKDDTFYKSCSMNDVYDAPRPQVRRCSLRAKPPRVVEMSRKRIVPGLFNSDGLDSWIKDETCTRQIEPWRRQNDVYCSNKHLLHTCFPREYNRLMQFTRDDFDTTMRRESEKVKLLKQVKAEHLDVLARMEKLQKEGIHGLSTTKIPGQLKSLERMQEDTTIPMQDAFYYYGFHPFPMEAVEEQYETKFSTSHKVSETPGLFLWSRQKLRVK